MKMFFKTRNTARSLQNAAKGRKVVDDRQKSGKWAIEIKRNGAA